MEVQPSSTRAARRGAAALVVLVALAPAGCSRSNDSPPATPPRPGPPRLPRVPSTDDPDAGAAALPELPQHLVGPLAACTRRVGAATPPELTAALAALEYGSAVEDACRLELAVRTREPAVCDGVALSAVRDACHTRAAIAAARPEACPPARVDRGRDPLCVALAARSAPLCAAALPADQVRCTALAQLAPGACDALDPLLRPRCTAELAALRPALLAPLRGALLPRGTAHLRVLFDDGAAAASDAPAPPSSALRPAGAAAVSPASTDAASATVLVRDYDLDAFARGVYLAPGGVQAVLIDPLRGWPTDTAAVAPGAPPLLGVRLGVPARPGQPGTVLELRVVMPDGLVLELPAVPPPGAPRPDVRFTRVTRERGGLLEGSVRARATATGVPATIELTFRTWVRDVADPAGS